MRGLAALGVLSLMLVLGCGSGEQAHSTSSGDSTVAENSSLSAAKQPAASAPPRVLIRTSLGDIVVQLDPTRAPLTVDNFLSYVDSGHFDGTIFHQVVADYVVLGGGYTSHLQEKPSRRPIRNEADNGLQNKRGTIGMARQPDAIDSSTSQFYFNLVDNQQYLDHRGRTPEEYGYCVFGEVVEGMDVVDKIAQVEVADRTVDGEMFEHVPKQAVMIKSARRLK
jgi:cyclophilin family peptidyl-prolyl cis-trans isomerase